MRPTIAFLLIVAGVLLLLWNPWRPRDVSVVEGFMPQPVVHYPPALPVIPAAIGPRVETKRSPLADGLNLSTGSVRDDLEIVMSLFAEYRTVLHGNPNGSNREITNALSGGNRQLYAPLPRDHVAINPNGQLCDRWGTPYFLHILSRHHLEVRSAGPDGVLWNADDATISSNTRVQR